MHMWPNACGGPKLISGTFFYCSFFLNLTETRFLSQTKSLVIQLVLIMSLLPGSHVSASDTVITGRLPYPPSSNVASGDQTPSPVAYTANTLAPELFPRTLLFFHLAENMYV